MAEYYIDTTAITDGDGSIGSPFNTIVGRTWGTFNIWNIRCGSVIRDFLNITGVASDLLYKPYGEGPLPVFDGQNTLATSFSTNSKNKITIRGFRFINQNSSASGALAITGSTGSRIVEDCEFYNCRLGLGVSSSVDNIIRRIKIDVGNRNTLNTAYGVRVFGAASARNVFEDVEIYSTAGLTYGTGFELAAGSTTTIRRFNITARSCDGILARGATTGHIIESGYIGGDMKDLLAFEDSSSNIVDKVVLYQTGALNETYPCIKLGDNFGAGSPADNNSFRNVVCVSLRGLPIVLDDAGANNTLDYVRVWRPNNSLVMRNDISGGADNVFLTFAQMQAAGYNLNGSEGDPLIDGYGVPLANSPLRGAGIHTKYMVDKNRKQFYNPPSIGAYEYERPRLTRN